ncbi:MAG: RluA family pseudouridine synthase [Actinomycetota bacterium]|nr:RluA family pseudouridine synthase [Actinomycetota bacterium]MDQ5808238.1 RluA family pseudouridine synthase [Actinomycetota bacterium]
MRVKGDEAGQRLDALLAETLGSRSRAARLIDEGRVKVDGVVRPKRHKVAEGEEVVVDVPPEPEAPQRVDVPFDVALEDEHLLVVDKPAGVVVHPARGHRSGTLAQALSGRAAGGEDEWRAGIVHRLDRDTSGLMVVAKSEEAHRRLKGMIQRREVTREYLALVLGRPPARTGTIDAPIGRDRRHRTRVSTDTDEPREAVTHFEVERLLPEATLLRVRLETGRTHQIRAHLQAIGHPVAGDPDYGGAEAFGLRRQFLHATRLAFTHPFTEEPVDLTSPLPDDLRGALPPEGDRGAAG